MISLTLLRLHKSATYLYRPLFATPGKGDCPPAVNESYFHDDVNNGPSFRGYFTIDSENNCTAHPSTCAGNIISPNKCHWGSTYELFQFNDFGIPDRMKRMGKTYENSPEGSYTTKHMFQIWNAAVNNSSQDKESAPMGRWLMTLSESKFR